MSAALKSELQIVGKIALCSVLGWSRDRLDRMIANDPAFPVEERGALDGRAQGWKFDVDKVRSYLAVLDHEATTKITPRGRRELAQAQKIEDQLRVARGELVEAVPFRAVMIQAFQIWATHDASASDTIGSRLNLDEDEVAIVREILDDRRRELVQALEDYTNEAEDDD